MKKFLIVFLPHTISNNQFHMNWRLKYKKEKYYKVLKENLGEYFDTMRSEKNLAKAEKAQTIK